MQPMKPPTYMEIDASAIIRYDGDKCDRNCDFADGLSCRRYNCKLRYNIVNPYRKDQVITLFRAELCKAYTKSRDDEHIEFERVKTALLEKYDDVIITTDYKQINKTVYGIVVKHEHVTDVKQWLLDNSHKLIINVEEDQ